MACDRQRHKESAHRQPVKSKHEASDRRQQLRAACLERVREHRSDLLDKLRHSNTTPEAVEAGMASILVDLANTRNLSGILGQPSSTRSQVHQEACDQDQLIKEDYEALVEEMKAAVFEQTSWEDLHRVEDAEVDEISQKFLEHCLASSHVIAVGGSAAREQVLCPVCQRAYLVESQGTVSCPQENYQIEVPMPGTQADCLSYVRARIGEVLEQHKSTACTQLPRFFVSNQHTGVWTLFVACDTCNALAAVV